MLQDHQYDSEGLALANEKAALRRPVVQLDAAVQSAEAAFGSAAATAAAGSLSCALSNAAFW